MATSSPANRPTDDSAISPQPELSRTNPWLGRLLIITAAILWSSSGFFAKNPAFDRWLPEQRGLLLAFWRALFAGLLILPAVRKPRWNFKLLPMAGCFAAMNITYLSAMVLTTAANAIWLQSTAPWWIFAIGCVVLRQPMNRADLITLVPGGIGAGLILWHELGGQAQIGILCGLGSAISYAGVVMFLRALRGEDSAWLVSVNHLATAALLAPWALAVGALPTGNQWPLLLGFGFLQMALPYTLFARGLRSVSSLEASALALLEPVLTPLWAYLVRGEIPAWWTAVGALLILLGLIIRYAGPLVAANFRSVDADTKRGET